MIDLILKSTLVLGCAALAAWLLRRQSASLLHRVWTAGLVAALALPLVSQLAPGWGSSWLPSADAALTRLEPGFGLAHGLWFVWVGGALVGLGVMLAGTVRLVWLVLGAEPLADSRWRKIAAELAHDLGLRRRVQLLASSHVRFLGTWGILRPRILVPAAAAGWSDQRIRAALAHELAHVARGDWAVQVLAEAARAIYWFNPLFWLLVSRMRQASEHAADNVALRLGITQADYARELLEISQFLGARDRQGPILAIAQPSFLERRLVAVLHPGLKRMAAAPWATVVIMLLAVALSVPLAMLREDSSAPLAADGAEVTGAAAGGSCPVTPTVEETPPDPELAAAFGDGPWHVNEDRSIWVWAQPYVAQEPVNAIWIRPEGTRLSLSAERLDGSAAPVETSIGCCYPYAFKTAGLQFPTPGCWRVDAVAGDRRLSFVTEVRR